MEQMKRLENGVWLLNEEFLMRCYVVETLVRSISRLTSVDPEAIFLLCIDKAQTKIDKLSEEERLKQIIEYIGEKDERESP